MKITALAGGTGAAKLLRGLGRVLDPRDLTVVVNTGDDTLIWGLHVFHARDEIARYGEPVWFNLGDRDLATHLHRSRLLREGRSLTQITRAIAQALGVTATVLPMSDQPVRTRILGPDGWLAFQEYFVREKAQVEVRAVNYAGAPAARPAPGVLDALRTADAILLCPSNPITSIGPILAVPGLVEALQSTQAIVAAVSPIVGGDAVSGPAGRLMAAAGLPVSATGVARVYGGWLDLLVFDEQDRTLAPEIRSAGAAPVVAPTMMSSRDAEVTLARHVVAALEAARAAR